MLRCLRYICCCRCCCSSGCCRAEKSKSDGERRAIIPDGYNNRGSSSSRRRGKNTSSTRRMRFYHLIRSGPKKANYMSLNQREDDIEPASVDDVDFAEKLPQSRDRPQASPTTSAKPLTSGSKYSPRYSPPEIIEGPIETPVESTSSASSDTGLADSGRAPPGPGVSMSLADHAALEDTDVSSISSTTTDTGPPSIVLVSRSTNTMSTSAPNIIPITIPNPRGASASAPQSGGQKIAKRRLGAVRKPYNYADHRPGKTKSVSLPANIDASVEDLAAAEARARDQGPAEMKLSLFYDEERNALTVHIIQAFGFPSSIMDPYIFLYLLPGKENVFQTHSVAEDKAAARKRSTCTTGAGATDTVSASTSPCTVFPDPVFDQLFVFRGVASEEVVKRSLVLRAYENSKAKNAFDCFIGSIVLPLKEADLLGSRVKVAFAEGLPTKASELDSQGELLLSLTYHLHKRKGQAGLGTGTVAPGSTASTSASASVSRQILGTVSRLNVLRETSGLEGAMSADLFVKIRLYYNNSKIDKWTSTTKRKTLLQPVFNESFEFNLAEAMEDLSRVVLEVKVLMPSRNRFASKAAVIGKVFIGECVPSRLGRDHWTQMMNSSGYATSLWHSIEKDGATTLGVVGGEMLSSLQDLSSQTTDEEDDECVGEMDLDSKLI